MSAADDRNTGVLKRVEGVREGAAPTEPFQRGSEVPAEPLEGTRQAPCPLEMQPGDEPCPAEEATAAARQARAQQAVGAVQTALRLVCVTLPHLVGLARAVRPQLDYHISTAAVFASGRLLINPDFILSLKRREAMFVLAHELLHLALRSHERQEGADPRLFNIAHDYIINDILRHDLECPIPAGGLDLEGARNLSAEKIVTDVLRKQGPGKTVRVWQLSSSAGASSSGTVPPEQDILDVLNAELEREWFPDVHPTEQQKQDGEIRALAVRAESLGVWRDRLNELQAQAGRGSDPGNRSHLVDALRRHYKPPWEVALQRWLDAVAPGPRTFARPSRRESPQPDVVLPGRLREGWTLHIVLDTSGSMTGIIARALGTIADFCAAAGVDEVHLLQCDVKVMKDEWVTPEELAHYQVLGYGGSNMTPAMEQLATNSEVEAAIVLTDGDIVYPKNPPPYHVLWVLTTEWGKQRLRATYGQVVTMGG